MSVLTVMTYNIRHGKGMDGKLNLDRIAATIATVAPDLVGLQEVDHLLPRSRFQRQAARLGRKLGMYHVLGANLNFFLGRYGNAILSRYPIYGYQNHHLPGAGERRSLLAAYLRANGRDICFFNTHLGLNTAARQQQVAAIIKLMESYPGPVILTGDFNARPESPELAPLVSSYTDTAAAAGNPQPNFPSDQPRHRIDCIFTSPHWQVINSTTLDSLASDHLPLYTRLMSQGKGS